MISKRIPLRIASFTIFIFRRNGSFLVMSKVIISTNSFFMQREWKIDSEVVLAATKSKLLKKADFV